MFNNSNNYKILSRGFYSRDTATVAKELIGKALVRQYHDRQISGIITETEAYYGETDPASHAFRGRTPRSEIMFGKAGIIYIYFCYGMYYMLNVVTEREEVPGAVLIRSLLPLSGIDIMSMRRNTGDIKNLVNGPGKITIALSIDMKDNGKDLTCTGNLTDDLTILDQGMTPDNNIILQTPRIGISYAKDKNLRFVLKDTGIFNF
jgi:DNA-3-methyladenine glycosylase